MNLPVHRRALADVKRSSMRRARQGGKVKCILKRVSAAIVSMFIVITVVFLLMRLMPVEGYFGGRAIMRIQPLSSGEIRYNGQRISGSIPRELDSEMTRKIQMIF